MRHFLGWLFLAIALGILAGKFLAQSLAFDGLSLIAVFFIVAAADRLFAGNEVTR